MARAGGCLPVGKPLLGSFERVTRERVAVRPGFVLLCAWPRADPEHGAREEGLQGHGAI
jgi:hypothetical protein